jgi:hypothetical protein
MPTYCHTDSTDVIENDYNYISANYLIGTVKLTINSQMDKIKFTLGKFSFPDFFATNYTKLVTCNLYFVTCKFLNIVQRAPGPRCTIILLVIILVL